MRNTIHHTSYYFLPYWREGLSARIEKPPERYRASVEVEGEIIPTQLDGGEGEPTLFSPPNGIELYSPGDIIGYDSAIVSRTDPQPHTNDFEPNFFPSVEFTDPDFPWRFSPLPPEPEAFGDGIAGLYRLQPWLSLVVLITDSKDAEFTESSLLLDSEEGEKTQRVFSIQVLDVKKSLPDLNQAWRWAHVHITGRDGLVATVDTDKDSLKKWVKDHPQLAVSRLICARRLRPNTKYAAFVVPTFRSGREAGCGKDPRAVDPLARAWNINSDADQDKQQVNLPYYYKWTFRTGDVGDFEALVTRLHPRKIENVGLRPMDCSKPGFGLPPVYRIDRGASFPSQLDVEGALVSLNTVFSPWGYDDQGSENRLQQELEPFLNQPKKTLDQASSEPPEVSPPSYGCWNSMDGSLDATRQTWFDELNLDPRHRVIAGLGAQVIRDNQEAYMKAAWRQMGDYLQARVLINAADLGIEASWCLFKRFRFLPDNMMLKIFGPLLPQIPGLGPDGDTLPSLFQHIRKLNDLLPPILDFSWDGLSRPLGPIKTRPRIVEPDDFPDMMRRFNNVPDEIGDRPGIIPDFSLPPDGLPRLSDITADIRIPGLDNRVNIGPDQPIFSEKYISSGRIMTAVQELEQRLDVRDWIQMPGSGDIDFNRNRGRGVSTIAGSPLSSKRGKGLDVIKEQRTVSQVGSLSPTDKVYVGQAWNSQRESITEAITKCFTLTDSMSTLPSVPLDLTELRSHLVKTLSPSDRISDQLVGRLRYKKNKSGRPGSQVFDPEFPQPLYEEVRDRGIEWLMPGASGIKENTIGLLETNRRFIESFLCGCNHAFSQELLWREFPSDQKGTYFAQFWDVRGYDVPEEKRKDIRQKIINARQRRALEEEIRGHYGIRVRVSLNNLDETLRRLIKAALQDITPLERWRELPLGSHEPNKNLVTNTTNGDSEDGSNVVLIVRGDLLRKYPNTTIYSVDAIPLVKGALPDLPEYHSKDFFRKNDFTNLKKFVVEIRNAADPLSQYLKDHLTVPAKELVDQYAGSGPLPESLLAELLKNLNQIILDNPLYSEQRFAHVTLSEETKALKEQNPQGKERIALNRLLLVDAYPHELAPSGVESSKEIPIFHGSFPPDMTFFGFPFNQMVALGDLTQGDFGKFFVLEEPAGEPRFGLDVPEEKGLDFDYWNQLTWAHFEINQDEYLDVKAPPQPTNNGGIFWETSSATIGRISCQKPFRVAVRAWRMIPDAINPNSPSSVNP